MTLHQVALFVSAYYFVFLLTTMAGLFRWIFQVGESFGTKCRDGNRSARTQVCLCGLIYSSWLQMKDATPLEGMAK